MATEAATPRGSDEERLAELGSVIGLLLAQYTSSIVDELDLALRRVLAGRRHPRDLERHRVLARHVAGT